MLRRLIRIPAAGFAQSGSKNWGTTNRCSLSPREKVRVRGSVAQAHAPILSATRTLPQFHTGVER